jgi:hypothetical protein
MGESSGAGEHPTVSTKTGPPVERAAHRGGRLVLGQAHAGVGLLVIAGSLISLACAAETTTSASPPGSRISFVIATNRVAGLRITPDTSYRGTLRYFARAGQHGSSSFPDGLCRLRLGKIGLSTVFFTLVADVTTPRNCRHFPDAVVTGSRWRTANGLRVGATVASLRRLFPRAYNSGKIPGRRWGIPTGSTVWYLTNLASSRQAARPVLVGYVRGGRVVALGIRIVGH